MTTSDLADQLVGPDEGLIAELVGNVTCTAQQTALL